MGRGEGLRNGVAATRHASCSSAGRSAGTLPQQFESDDFVAQARQALANIVAVLAEAGARPEHVARMTWYVVDKREYLACGRPSAPRTARSWDATIPAMTAVEVAALMEDAARVEIEATAVIPD